MAGESGTSESGPPNREGAARRGEPSGVQQGRVARWFVAAAVLVLASASAVFLVMEERNDCDGVERYTVAVSSDFAPVISEIAGGIGCVAFEVVEQEPGEVSARLGADHVPDLWIPAGGWWASWAGRTATGPVRTVSTPLATTPLVLAGVSGDVEPVPDWRAALSVPDLVFGNPLRSGPPAGAIRAVLAEAADDPVAIGTVRPIMAPLAEQERLREEEVPVGSRLLEQISASGGTAVSTEQQVDTFRRIREDHLGTAVPATGTLLVDYPLVVTARGERHDQASAAAAVLTEALHAGRGLDRLARHGFRDGGGRALPDDRGVGPVPVLALQDESVHREAMDVWALQALSVRTLFAVDVSASMNRDVGDASRIDLVRRATLAADDVLPESMAAGLWFFGGGVGGEEHVEAAPIRRFDSTAEGRTHRNELTSLLASTAGTNDENTELYDTTLAAFRHVQDGYDPRAAHSVVVVTDGTDTGSEISKEELLEALRTEADPSRPVRVVTIALGENVDSATLEQIAAVTGGTAYRTSDPLDITNLVLTALADRTGR